MKQKIVEKIKKQLLGEIEGLKDKKGFIQAGAPRFLGLYGRDSLITAWQMLDFDPKIARNTLLILAKLQGKKINPKTGEKPGKILHEYYSKNITDGWWKKYKKYDPWLKRGEPFYMSVDSTPLFLIVLAKYFQKTKDKKLILKLLPNAKKAIDWLINYGGLKDGFLRHSKRKTGKGLASQSWKDGAGNPMEKMDGPIAVAEVQGYAYLALKETANLAKILNEEKLAGELLERAKILKKDFNEKFWMEDKQYFALALDKKNKQKKSITSNPGHLLFTGILDKKRTKIVTKRLFEKDMWTPFGVRTHSTIESDFNPLSYQNGAVWPHDNWIIAQGLKKLGYKKEYNKIKNALLRAHQEIGFIPEFYGVVDNKIILKKMDRIICHPQAWASAALLNFLLR